MPEVQKEALHRSTERWGFVEPLVVRQGNEVVGGNQRLDEALASNQKEIPIIRIRINDREAKALNLALNKIHGEWDTEKLAPLLVDLEDLPEISLTGFGIEEIERILSDSQIPDLSETRSDDDVETPSLSLVPYFGGKQALVAELMAMIPPHVSYVEVFGGGAALLLNKPPSDIEVYNDIDSSIVNLFEVIRDNPDQFLKRAEYLVYSRELFDRWADEVRSKQWPTDPVERALRYWYVLRCSFAAHPEKGWAFSRDDNRQRPKSLHNNLLAIKKIHERLKLVEIDNLDFRSLIKNRDAPTTIFYLDPPYLDADAYASGDFTLQDHCDLADALKHVEAKWLMTIGDHPEIRRLYADRIRGKLESTLSVEKVLKEDGTGRRKLTHLIISNYPLPEHGELPRPETSAAAIHREEGD
jgi:DNA adenine methylase